MTVFEDYARYYDLFYEDKNYSKEAAFVRSVLLRHSSTAHSILDLGCGTARHAVELARLGFAVTGVDKSVEMLAVGRRRLANSLAKIQASVVLVQGDVTEFRSNEKYDAAVSLFHVASYQSTNGELRKFLTTARNAIVQEGVFIFDFWYGPAVLAQGAEPRTKRVSDNEIEAVRVGQPTFDTAANIVNVKYTINILDRLSGQAIAIDEVHSLRYLFVPEIHSMAQASGFDLVEFGEWLTRKPLHDQSWSGYAVARPSRMP